MAIRENLEGIHGGEQIRTLSRLRGLVGDWQANGNSRELGDPRADVWQECARQLLDALKPKAATHE